MEFIHACSVEIGINKVLILVYLVNYDIVVCIYACCTYVCIYIAFLVASI